MVFSVSSFGLLRLLLAFYATFPPIPDPARKHCPRENFSSSGTDEGDVLDRGEYYTSST